jgi:uncharacterized protein
MTMILDLRRLAGGVEQVSRRFEAAAFEIPPDDFRIVAPVDLAAEAYKTGTKVRLVGRMTTSLEVACSRCVEPLVVPVEAALDLLFLPAALQPHEGERETNDEDVGVSFYQNDQIDLGEVIREQCYLALPMKPLCKEDCQGLCPVCGINRNREACSCEHAWVDPRLDVLRRIKSSES